MLTDNRPLFPLITKEKCDAIVVICLGALSEEQRQGEQRRWQELYRLLDLIRLDQNHLAMLAGAAQLEKNAPPTNLPYRDVPEWPQLLYLTPKESLGGFRDGTMNFTAEYARRLMRQGYADGIAFLDAHAAILRTSPAS